MKKNFKEINPELKKGDVVMLLHMEGETGVPPGTTGVVSNVGRDPFEKDGNIIYVSWENGSRLSLISATDAWKKIGEKIQEQTLSPQYDFFNANPELFEHFDWKFLRKYLYKLRESGVINMLQAAPFLYSGKEWIDRYHGENQEDNEAFQDLLEMADEAKDKMVQGLVKFMSAKDIEMDDLDRVNHLLSKLALKINQLYMTFA